MYIHCRVRLNIFYTESLCPGSGLVETQTQHFLRWVPELWRRLCGEPDSAFPTLSVLLLMKKSPLYHVRLAEGPRYYPPADWRPDAAYCTPMTNALKESTTGCWPWIYFFQYMAVMTGRQLTANRISVAGYLHGWHQLAGVVLIRLSAVVCSCTHMAGSGLLKINKGPVSDIVLTIFAHGEYQ